MNDVEIAQAVDQILSRYTKPASVTPHDTVTATTALKPSTRNPVVTNKTAERSTSIELQNIVSQALAEALRGRTKGETER